MKGLAKKEKDTIARAFQYSFLKSHQPGRFRGGLIPLLILFLYLLV